MDVAPPRYSVVVPVFNEADNIGPFCRKALAELPPGYELLVCYDFDGDSTLPAVAALPAAEKPSIVRLVKNDLGRGVRYAIEAGMRAARAPVVVVMMADLSDDFAKVGPMVAKAEAGADVVCASRYMRGGQQVGGPRFKGFLSRMAGLTLHWFAGLPTHDPTNSFKAYRKPFLDRTPIESTAGFCLGLELTAKAHFRGGRVAEVPATWLDRTAGESRFQLRRWLPMYLRWYFWAFDQRYRTVMKRVLLALFAVVVFLSNLYVPFETATSLPEPGWQAGLGHAVRHRWRAGVDYVFTYGPLGVLTTRVFDPALFPARVAWEIGLTAIAAALAAAAVGSDRPWRVRLGLIVLLTAFREGGVWECKALVVMAGLVLAILDRPRPRRALAAAALALFAVLALTKFTMFANAAILGGGIVAHVAATRGWRSAAGLAAIGVGVLGAAWVIAGQSLADLPAFVLTSRLLAGGYSAAMHLDGPTIEVVVAVVGGGLAIVAAGLRGPSGTPRRTRALTAVAIGWLLFGFYKWAFVRHEPSRTAAYFWLLAVMSLWLWPAAPPGRRSRIAAASLAVAAGIGVYGVVARTDRWAVLTDWSRSVREGVTLLTDPGGRAAELAAQHETARAASALPRVAAVVGNRSIDMVTNRPGLILENGLNWTPRPMFMSYAACAPELLRLNRDFFRSPAAPDFVLFRGEPIDGRLFTQDDGPAVLELLPRYEPRLSEDGYLLLERRAEPGPDPVGEPLLDRDVQFDEVIDLAALGGGPKAISFQIDDSFVGRVREAVYRPPTVTLVVTLTTGQRKLCRLTPGMVRDPVLIDPLPFTVDAYADVFAGRLWPNVASVKLVVERPGLRKFFAAPMRCTVYAVRNLPVPADSRGDVGD